MDSEVFTDPYVYPGTPVLKNKLGLKDPARFKEAEYRATWIRREEMGDELTKDSFDLSHLQAINYQLFQDLFDWAGELRQVEIAKGSSTFHPSIRIAEAGDNLKSWISTSGLLESPSDDQFISAMANLLEKVNYIHPFREGNGRTQRAFLDQVASVSGRRLAWRNVGQHEHLRAMIKAFNEGSGKPLEAVIAEVMAPPLDGLDPLEPDVYSVAPPSAWPQTPFHNDPSTCGEPTTKGPPCKRKGRCPYHGETR